jgi:TM2 domain-containing membrane protein YozV
MTRLTSTPHELARLQSIWDCEGMGWAQLYRDCRAAGIDTRAWPLVALLAFWAVLLIGAGMVA